MDTYGGVRFSPSVQIPIQNEMSKLTLITDFGEQKKGEIINVLDAHDEYMILAGYTEKAIECAPENKAEFIPKKKNK